MPNAYSRTIFQDLEPRALGLGVQIKNKKDFIKKIHDVKYCQILNCESNKDAQNQLLEAGTDPTEI
jgi:hypothetical protein